MKVASAVAGIFLAALWALGCGAANDEALSYGDAGGRGGGWLDAESRLALGDGLEGPGEAEAGFGQDSMGTGGEALDWLVDALAPEAGWLCELPIARGDLIFSELMSQPAGKRHGNRQWVEFYNRLDEPVCLNGLVLRMVGTEAAETLIRGPEPLLVAGRGFGLAGGQSVRQMVDYAWEPEVSIPVAGGTLQLIGRDGELLDEIQVGLSKMPTVPNPKEGQSVYLCGQCLGGSCDGLGKSWSDIFLCAPPDCIDIEPYDDLNNLGTPGMANPSCKPQ